jgi:hypothetical protein
MDALAGFEMRSPPRFLGKSALAVIIKSIIGTMNREELARKSKRLFNRNVNSLY